MRYEILATKLDKFHPMNPNTTVWRIWDNKLKQFGLSYYLSQTSAEKMLEKRLTKEKIGV